MANEFHINRQFGVNIFIDVEKGIVTDIKNEKKLFIDKMMELYKGKSITFLKTNFEKRMKPAINNVRSTDVCNAQNNVNSIQIRLTNINNSINDLKPNGYIKYVGTYSKENEANDTAVVKLKMDNLEKDKENVQIELTESKETLSNVLKYVKEIHSFE